MTGLPPEIKIAAERMIINGISRIRVIIVTV